MSHWKETSPLSFFANENLLTLPDSSLRKIARSDAGEPSSITDRAKSILDQRRFRAAPVFLENALSPYERELYRLRAIPTRRDGSLWFSAHGDPEIQIEITGPTPPAQAAPLPDLSHLSDSQLQPLTKSSNPATRMAAIRILDQRAKDEETGTSPA